MAKILKLEDYTIVLFCPLVIEHEAACLILDDIHEGTPERATGQTVVYTLGRIGSYNVAIAGYPAGEAGTAISGSMASEALRDFPNLEAGLLVGIAAGIPSPTRDIRLGDVAVAVPDKDNPGVIGYDLVKVEEGEVRLKQWQNSTHSLLRSVITSIQVREERPGPNFTQHLTVFESSARFKRPNSASTSSEFVDTSRRDEPRVHYGTILSGNGVIKNKKRRDELRDKFNGIAIEMEAAGMMTRLPVAVIRGISDFADSDKNDEWQPYAALTAAAYAKEMLTRLGPRKVAKPEAQSVISSSIKTCLRSALPEQCMFVGREIELAKLEELVGFRPQQPPQKSVVTLWGLGGAGKSQLVSEFVKRQQEKHPDYEVFWTNGETKEAFEQSIASLLKAFTHPVGGSSAVSDNYNGQRTILTSSFFAELRSSMRTKWLLVIDGVSSLLVKQQNFREYMKELRHGSVILIMRSKEVVTSHSRWMEVKGLPEAAAVELLKKEIDTGFKERDEDMLELAKVLSCHPLSLRLTASVMSFHNLSVAEYIERWKKRQFDEGNLPTNEPLLYSFEISFKELSNANPLATNLLMLFGFLDHKDMWYDLCLGATNEDFPDWLHQVAHYDFEDFYAPMLKLSFVEAKLYGKNKELSYEIHPAIHEFARWKAAHCEEEYIKCAISLVAAKVPRSEDKDFLEIAKRLEPHADQCKIYLEQDRAGADLDLLELEKFGNLFRQLGRYEEASHIYGRILTCLSDEEQDSMTLMMMAGIENNLGLVYHAQRKYDLALQAFEESYQTQHQLSMQGQDAAISTVYNKGRSLFMLGRLDEALENLVVAGMHFSNATPYHDSGGDENTFGWEERQRIYYRILNDIGEIHLRKNDVEQAEQYFKEAFNGQKRESDPAAFAVRLNIGRVCVERLLFPSANKIFEYIIATYTEWWGRAHSETMRAVAELADSHLRHGEMKSLMRHMGDSGERELAAAAELWGELLAFHQEGYGTMSDIAVLARTKLEKLQLLTSAIPEDPYSMYYSPGFGEMHQ